MASRVDRKIRFFGPATKILVPALLVLCGGFPVVTAIALDLPDGDPPSLASTSAPVDRLIELLGLRDQLVEMATHLEPLIHQTAENAVSEYTRESREVHRKALQEKLNAFSRQILSWERVGPVYRHAYLETYQPDEIDAMVAFFESPIGQRYLQRQPLLGERIRGAMSSIVPDLLLGLESETAAFRREHPPGQPAGTSCCAVAPLSTEPSKP